MSNNVKICMITDENYAIPTIVSLTSAIINKNIDTQYEIYVITKNVSEFYKTKFKDLEQKNTQITIIDKNSVKINSVKKYSHVPETALIKFELCNILKNEHKILYIDGDTLIQKDLSELYNIDLGQNYAAVVQDVVGEEIRKLHAKCGVNKYFNSGVLLLNLDLLRKINSTEKLIDTKLTHPQWHCMDQDAFNYVFQNKILWLKPKYNATIAAFILQQFDILTINKYYLTNYFSFEEFESDTIINHFAGCAKIRPWEYSDVLFSNLWGNYYLQSPLKHVKLNRKAYNNLLYPKIRPILNQIFSITNQGCYKVICILGIKIKFKLN